MPTPDILEAIRQALIERGWKIDETVVENRGGELHEFIHPETGRRLAWLDAVFAQQDREVEFEKKESASCPSST
jgi:hypothetical protein